VAALALAPVENVAAQELMYDDPPVEQEFVDGPSILGGPSEYVGPDGVMAGPPPNYYYPPEAAEAGMPVAMPGIMPGDGDVPWHRGFGEPDCPTPPLCLRGLSRLGFRHSYTHGRSVGWGWPMTGTSWLNRPYYLGASIGPMWLTSRPIPSVERDTDAIGSIYFGWNWDYYWGSEFLYSYATPELRNRVAEGNPKSDRLAHWDYSYLYYPWGDSWIRPYWRFGIGNTKFDFPHDDGRRRDEWVLSTPFGVGVKYPVRRWLALRTEFTDQLSWANSGVATQHNLTLNFGFEFHFGGHRKSYWPWNPGMEFW
jgi:hypothetical protein